MGGTLDGITVLDLSTVGPASRASAALRDLGASLVKVLPPAGRGRTDTPYFAYGAGRGTKRIRIDLKAPEGRDVFLAMVGTADVVIESFRPGVADRLGIGYDDCRKANERVVYAAVSGFGREGPYSAWAAHDIDYLAIGGYLGSQGRRADGGPALPGITIADAAGGGLHAALAIAAALVERERTGQGRFLDVSTTDGVIHLMALFIDETLALGGRAGESRDLLTGRYACYDVYECADGKWLAVGAIESHFFANLCDGVGRPDLAGHQMDPARQDEIRAAFRAAFGSRPRDEWIAALAPADTCVAPVYSLEEVASDPHFRERGAFIEIEHPDHGRFRVVGPVLAGGEPPEEPVRVPGTEETHAEELLGAAGLASGQIATLRERGVVG